MLIIQWVRSILKSQTTWSPTVWSRKTITKLKHGHILRCCFDGSDSWIRQDLAYTVWLDITESLIRLESIALCGSIALEIAFSLWRGQERNYWCWDEGLVWAGHSLWSHCVLLLLSPIIATLPFFQHCPLTLPSNIAFFQHCPVGLHGIAIVCVLLSPRALQGARLLLASSAFSCLAAPPT